MSSDRAAVAREVLTELANWNMARVETLKDVMRFRDERYPAPAPAAPVTVTVVDGDGVQMKWKKGEGGYWVTDSGHVLSPASWAHSFAERVASDARRIEALEAANASLKAETDRISAMRQDALDELVRVGSERDEARRKLDAIQTPPSCSKMTSQGEGQQERLAAVAPSPASAEDKQGSPPAPVVPSPATIPLGAPRKWWMNCYSDSLNAVHESEKIADECADKTDPTFRRVVVVEAVADAATVKRVAQEIFHDRWRRGRRDGVRDTYRNDALAALRALGYTIQEGA